MEWKYEDSENTPLEKWVFARKHIIGYGFAHFNYLILMNFYFIRYDK